jgi:hypothetical protein
MFQRVRKQINPATILAFVALIFAATGGAFAATGGSSPAKASTSATHNTLLAAIAKKKPAPKGKAGPRGPAGKNGTNGTNGTNGAPGATGPAGAAGAKGETGSPGGPGANGTSVTSAEVLKSSATCNKQGGSEFTAGASKTTACNGKEGSPWTAGGTLPKGATETGVWSTGGPLPKRVAAFELTLPISFPIPLAAEKGLAESAVHIFEGETIPAGCTGTVVNEKVTDLGAESGNLCIYVVDANELTAAKLGAFNPEEPGLGAGKAGALLLNITGPAEEGDFAYGTWAVTG